MRAPRAFSGNVMVPQGIVGLREALGLERHHTMAECLVLAPTKVAAIERVSGLGIFRPEMKLAGRWVPYLALDACGLVTEDPILFYMAQKDRPIVRVLPDTSIVRVATWRYEHPNLPGGRGLYVEPAG